MQPIGHSRTVHARRFDRIFTKDLVFRVMPISAADLEGNKKISATFPGI